MQEIVSHIRNGIIAGFMATVVLSALMLMKSMMGLMPELNTIKILATMAGAQSSPAVGWVMHLFIGTVMWGTLFALVAPKIPGSIAVRGIIFSTIAWLLMMVIMMPMAGQGFFGMELGIMAPMITLLLHIIFGAVLGYTYKKLNEYSHHRIPHSAQ